jgi:hypothetical protein
MAKVTRQFSPLTIELETPEEVQDLEQALWQALEAYRRERQCSVIGERILHLIHLIQNASHK